MIDTGFLIAVVGAVLGAASMVLHVVAPRTKNTVDDEFAKDIDEVLAFVRGQIPTAGTAVVTSSASSAPSSTAVKAGTVATVTLLAAMIGGVSLAPACSTVSSDVKAFANGAVTCAKTDAAQAKALGLQLGIDALAGFLAGQDATTVWSTVSADAEAGAKTQGVAVGACAFDGVIADVEKILHPTTPGIATSALTASAAVDPLAAGRAALAAFESAHGVTQVLR